jgi:hypothetical protein
MAQLIASGLFFISDLLIDFEGSFNKLSNQTLMSYDVFITVTVILIELLIVFLIYIYWHNQFYPKRSVNIKKLIEKGESSNLEFKQSLRWDIKNKKVNKSLENVIIKSIAAFLNSDGGTLAVGVDDNGEVKGLKDDFNSLTRKKDKDEFENHFINLFKSQIGLESIQFINTKFYRINGKYIYVIKITPSTYPIFIKLNGSEEFYIRSGNSSRPLTISQAHAYINNHWGEK